MYVQCEGHLLSGRTLRRNLNICYNYDNCRFSVIIHYIPAKACRVVPEIRQAAAPVLAVATVLSGGRAAIM